jgi:hypothetical protein
MAFAFPLRSWCLWGWRNRRARARSFFSSLALIAERRSTPTSPNSRSEPPRERSSQNTRSPPLPVTEAPPRAATPRRMAPAFKIRTRVPHPTEQTLNSLPIR